MNHSQQHIQHTIAERNERYGSFASTSSVSQELKETMHQADCWDALSADKKEALELIATKIGRILTGNPDYIDTWHDIAGYAILIENTLQGESRDKETIEDCPQPASTEHAIEAVRRIARSNYENSN